MILVGANIIVPVNVKIKNLNVFMLKGKILSTLFHDLCYQKFVLHSKFHNLFVNIELKMNTISPIPVSRISFLKLRIFHQPLLNGVN